MSLLVLTTGLSINTFIPELRKFKDRPTFAWSRSIEFFIERLNFAPTYWSFLDPGSAINGLDYIRKHKLNTKVFLFSPFLHSNLDVLRQNVGRPSSPYNIDNHYEHYLQRIRDVDRMGNLIAVPTLTMKYLTSKHLHAVRNKKNRGTIVKDKEAIKLRSYELEGRHFKKRLNYHKLILGSSSVDKLMMCILPLISFLHKNDHLDTNNKDILDLILAGFDGKGRRFHENKSHTNPNHAVRMEKHFKKMRLDREMYGAKWKAWIPHSQINPIALDTGRYSDVHEHFETVTPEEAFK